MKLLHVPFQSPHILHCVLLIQWTQFNHIFFSVHLSLQVFTIKQKKHGEACKENQNVGQQCNNVKYLYLAKEKHPKLKYKRKQKLETRNTQKYTSGAEFQLEKSQEQKNWATLPGN